MRSPLVCGLLGRGLSACGEMPAGDTADASGLIAGSRPPAALERETVYRAPMTGKASTTCAIKRDLKLCSLDGHQHEWGSRVDVERLDGTSSTVLWSHPWIPEYQLAPPVNVCSVEKPLLLEAGQSVRVRCEWNHPTAGELRFPREMCVGTGFYSPATGSIGCEEGAWSECSPAA